MVWRSFLEQRVSRLQDVVARTPMGAHYCARSLWKRKARAQRTYGAMMNSCRIAEQKLPASTCSSPSSATCNMTLPLES